MADTDTDAEPEYDDRLSSLSLSRSCEGGGDTDVLLLNDNDGRLNASEGKPEDTECAEAG